MSGSFAQTLNSLKIIGKEVENSHLQENAWFSSLLFLTRSQFWIVKTESSFKVELQFYFNDSCSQNANFCH